MVLHSFIAWLQQRSAEAGAQKPSLSQSEIARRSGLSQSMVNKIMQRRGTLPSPSTFQRICGAFWHQWVQFLGEHQAIREQLARDYQWVSPVISEAPVSADADLAEGIGLLRAIFSSETHKGLVIQQLRAQASFIGVRPTRARARPAARRRRG